MTVLVRHLSAEKLKELNQIFRSLDIDNSGYISHEELAVGLQRVGISAET